MNYGARLDSAEREMAPSIDRPDSLRRSGSGFVRRVSGGTRVIFDSLGRHVTTRNRLNRETTFEYDSRNRLTFVIVPARDVVIVDECVTGPQGLPICTMSERIVGRWYSFLYASDGSLRQVIAPPASDLAGSARTTNVTVRGGRLEALQDAAMFPISFGYLRPGSTRIVSRKDPNGYSARYAYDGGGKITSYDQERATGGWDLVTLRTAETVGLASAGGLSAADPAAAYTKLDGPRIDVGDTTSFWLDRYGAPTLLRNALGHETRLNRTDARFPGLVTEVIAANGFTTRAAYDAGGNVATSTQVNPYDNGDAITTYAWDAKWDLPTSVTLPEGEVTTFAYDAVTGNRLYQQLGPDAARRVVFAYDTAGLLSSVTEPGTPAHTLGYDTNGNVSSTVNALGVKREVLTDAAGQVVRVRTPVDQSQTIFQTDTTIYDVLGRVVRAESFGPATPGDQAKRAIVQNFYDSTGNLTRIERSASPDEAVVGVLSTRYAYDELHRRTTETHGDNTVERSVYDPAGNVIRIVSRMKDPSASANPLEIQFTYDALNRLRERALPAVRYPPRAGGIATSAPHFPVGDSITADYPRYPNDPSGGYLITGETARFEYDVVGRMISATNSDARVARTYLRGGAVKADTLKVRNLADTVFSHVYALGFRYDRNGRRVRLIHPPNIAAGVGKDTTSYSYDPGTGELISVKDALQNEFRFHYNVRGELDTLYRPGSTTEALAFDGLGRMIADNVSNPDPATGTLRATALSYDVRDKLTSVGNGVQPFDSLRPRYTGLGHVAAGKSISRGLSNGGFSAESVSADSIVTDAIGNLVRRYSSIEYRTTRHSESSSETLLYAYSPQMGRLASLTTGRGQTHFRYDSAGNEVFRTGSAAEILTDRASWYDAAGKLRAADARTYNAVNPLDFRQFTFEEYRYDALGRRVWVRARRWCNYDPQGWKDECSLSKVRRTVWDGDQELYEMQVPGDAASPYVEADTVYNLPALWTDTYALDQNIFFGRVSYTHALGIDQPLGIIRMNYGERLNSADGEIGYAAFTPFAILPIWNEQGQPQIGVFEDGKLSRCDALRCVNIVWPGSWFAYVRPKFRPNFWHGSLLEDKQDATGTHYRRARVYDPATGRFTQEDPIGLAGGINLYGFAGGDPVNFSDPFGQCALPSAVANVAMGVAIAGATGSGYGLGAAALDVAMGCIGVGTISKAARLAKLVRANKQAGDAFEATVGIASRGKRAIPSLSGTALRRIPDEMTDLVLREAKSGSSIKLTNQIQDFLDYSRETGRRFILEVRIGARVDGKLLDLEKAGQLAIRRY